MKTTTKAVIALSALCAAALIATAQDSGNGQGQHPRGPGMGGHRPPPPVIAVLDANHDGVIDAAEIANASAALLTLDKNGDGQLTQDELRPPFPEGRPPGGPEDGK